METCGRYSADFLTPQQGRYSGARPTAPALLSMLAYAFHFVYRNKREERSYREIALSLGVEDCAQITFCTDVYEEAKAAQDAGAN